MWLAEFRCYFSSFCQYKGKEKRIWSSILKRLFFDPAFLIRVSIFPFMYDKLHFNLNTIHLQQSIKKTFTKIKICQITYLCYSYAYMDGFEWLNDVVIFPHKRNSGVLKNGFNNKQPGEKLHIFITFKIFSILYGWLNFSAIFLLCDNIMGEKRIAISNL